MERESSTPASSWLGIDEAAPFAGKKATKAAAEDAFFRRWPKVVNATLVVFIMTMPPLLILLGGGRPGAPAVWIKSTVASLAARGEPKKDVLLGGLLLPGFDEQSCVSRYQSVYYRKNMTRPPSPHLLRRLRQQEALQRRCGPGTEPYRRASERLRSGQNAGDDFVATVDGCGYLVLISYRGLGNRILAITSAFLYAMLTGRVLLLDPGKTMADLFCEPFQGTSWMLPGDFPLEHFRDLGEDAPESYGNVAVNRSGSVAGLRFVYAHLDHGATPANRLLYCDDHRQFLHRVQWVILRTDSYIAPGIFLNPAYKEELDMMFPNKDAVFYLLSRYLLHPTNDVWGMVTRFYHSYLKNADERLGIQIRVFDGDEPFQHILDQILACTSQEHLLPGVVVSGGGGGGVAPPPIARIRDMYWRSPSATGEVVSVHQPSHELHQHFFRSTHDMKALAEMYLLSLTDKIVTSGWSTFGYVGSGLGGLTPYIMIKPENHTVPNPPCVRAMSMEPCDHGPPYFECTKKEIDKIIDTGNLVPHVRSCEDVPWGRKLAGPIS
uniref:Fucosyltransferase n=1 Tax=Oryza meridionalis TaxID=40149 RepID=A0A0E0DYR6_9ORYZ